MTAKEQLMTTPAIPSTRIEGVYTVPIKAYADERGRFMETFRREWFPWVNWDKMQSNRSESKKDVLRGLHYHLWQIDYWYVVNGIIRVGMVDLRPSSPTYMAVEVLEIGESNNIGVFIPMGVAHGFLALTDATLTYLVNNYYDGGRDERGVAWNDPAINIPWGIENPLISDRDRQNRLLRDIPADELPK
ncbi:MAG TPA: dTDP-4-dehydrorhamnose 3,5-epimerase family protein [Spirillospora sp.]|nr:dTDP-4-dehydrorhamnose 3,5-epimerase family protein [Spirillospora sp.]